jgi:hypothetical protein
LFEEFRGDPEPEWAATTRQVRAVVTAAAQRGRLHVAGTALRLMRDRRPFMDDPALAVYNAYGLFDLREHDALRSEDARWRDALRGTSLFDIALLTHGFDGFSLEEFVRSGAVTPSVPMLTQGWDVLDTGRSPQPKQVRDLKTMKLPSLWTVFDAAAYELLVAWQS